MKNLKITLITSGILFVAAALGYQLTIESWGNQSLGNNDWLARFTSIAQPVLFGLGSFLLGFALLNAGPFLRCSWQMKTGLLLGCLAMLIMTKGFSFVFVRGAFERSVASRDQVAEKSASVQAWEATERALLAELEAAKQPSVLLEDHRKAMGELRNEIEALIGQATSLDNDGNAANDREIPSFLARVESKKADLATMETAFTAMRGELIAVAATIQKRLDTHRATQAAALAGVATATKSVHQFDRWAEVLTVLGIESDHKRALNLVISVMSLGIILLEYIGLALISVATRLPGGKKVAAESQNLAAQNEETFAYLYGDMTLDQLRSSTCLIRKRHGNQLVPVGTAQIKRMDKAQLHELHTKQIIPSAKKAITPRPFVKAAELQLAA